MKQMSGAERQDVIEKAMDLARHYQRTYGGCPQVVLAAIRETLGGVGDDVFQAATGLAGGVGRTGRACGALTGGVMALSCFWGRPYDDFEDSGDRRALCIAMSRRLAEKFLAEYGSEDCHGIHKKLMGRAYDLNDPEQAQEYARAGGHDVHCPSVCANSARWVIEILAEEGLI